MARILVSGLINIETTLCVEKFPIHYNPVNFPFFGIQTTVSGVGFNITKALSTLGDQVNFISILGKDFLAQQVRNELSDLHISDRFVINSIAQSAQSIIIYDQTGKRQVYCDLKDIQEQSYPIELFDQAILESDLLVLCNINFSRDMLQKAKKTGRLIATDVHLISNLQDDYNRDFMAAADILFMSDESLPVEPEEWARQVIACYHPMILVIGLGAKGALLCVPKDNNLQFIPAIPPPKIVNTIGAGDALFSAFLHCYLQTKNPYESIRKAVLFASQKIGSASASQGFIDDASLNQLYNQYHL